MKSINKEKIVTLTIDDIDVLAHCVRIEEKCAEIYRHFERIHAEQPDIARLWNKTASEEDNHAEQFRLAVRLRGAGMEVLNKSLPEVTSILERIETLLAKMQGANPPPADALIFAIQLEESLAEYHMSCLVNYADVSLSKLFTSMAKNDNGHIDMLQKALAGYTSSFKPTPT